MAEVEITFEPEGRSGVVPVNTYLLDAAKRFGVAVEADCGRLGECDSCCLEVKSGKNLLSEATKAELEQLGSDRYIGGERLSCQAKIEREGEITIMVKEKKKSAEEEAQEAERKTVEDFRKEFDEMPLEKKIAALVELEGVALSETFSFVFNSPYLIVGKIMDVMAEFGLKLENEDKNKKRPAEHKTQSKDGKKKDQAAREQNASADDATTEAA